MGIVAWQLHNPYNMSEGDEKLYIQIVKDMQRHNEAFRLTYFDKPAYFKPPLLYWDAYLFTKIFGSSIWVYRLLSFLYLLACFLIINYLYRDFYPDSHPHESFVAAGLFSGTWAAQKYGTLFMMDIPLVAWVLIGYAMYRSMPKVPALVFGILSGFATFMKGPIGWVLSGLMLGVHLLVTRQRVFKDTFQFVVGSALMIGLLLGFCAWVYPSEVFGDFINQFLGPEHLMKFQGNWWSLFSGPYPMIRIWGGWIYLLAPFVVLASLPILRFVQGKLRSQSDRILVFTVLAILVLFTLPTQRQENYILLTTPLVCMLITRVLYTQPSRVIHYLHEGFIMLLLLACIGFAWYLSFPTLLILGVVLFAMWIIGLHKQWLPMLPALGVAFWIGVQQINLDMSMFQAPSQALQEETRGHTVLYDEHFRSLSTWIQFLLPDSLVWPLSPESQQQFPNAQILTSKSRYQSDFKDHQPKATWYRWKRAIPFGTAMRAIKQRQFYVLMEPYVLLEKTGE